jgi:LPPG:FO 2-phospho-L-lactate transferase
MMQEMNLPVTARAVAEYYGNLIDGFVYDQQDAGSLDGLAVAQLCVDTLMHTAADRARLAQDALTFAMQLAGSE